MLYLNDQAAKRLQKQRDLVGDYLGTMFMGKTPEGYHRIQVTLKDDDNESQPVVWQFPAGTRQARAESVRDKLLEWVENGKLATMLDLHAAKAGFMRAIHVLNHEDAQKDLNLV